VLGKAGDVLVGNLCIGQLAQPSQRPTTRPRRSVLRPWRLRPSTAARCVRWPTRVSTFQQG
jgi:hypothetical protein